MTTRLPQLQASLAETAREGVFAIGGQIQLDEAQPLQVLIRCQQESAVPLSAAPSAPAPVNQAVLPWQLPLPSEQRSPKAQEPLLQAIIAQCTPATFGRGSEAVLDPSYRSAYHLSSSRFVTSFHPAQPGCSMLTDVARMLEPSASFFASPPAIQVELYNLNVYGPGGHFRAHVDTPRADNMFGSLVVCLPVPFQGGQLVVRHGGQSRVFDWSFEAEGEEKKQSEGQTGVAAGGSGAGGSESGAAGAAGQDSKDKQLQWAAFFGNCEHEVRPVTSGYRCTLTYNLYRQQPASEPPQSSVTATSALLDRHHLPELGADSAVPLVRQLREALADPDWMAAGGVLGIKCEHAYAHTSSANQGSRVRPAMLKGVDAVLYAELAQKLRLKVNVKLVIESHAINTWREEFDEEDELNEEGIEDMVEDEDEGEAGEDGEKDEDAERGEHGEESGEEASEHVAEQVIEEAGEQVEDAETDASAEAKEPDSEAEVKEDVVPEEEADARVVYVSGVMQPAMASSFNECESGERELPIEEVLPYFKRYSKRVVWLNQGEKGKRGSKEFAVSYDLMGNEPCSAWLYTEVALLVHVPPYGERTSH